MVNRFQVLTGMLSAPVTCVCHCCGSIEHPVALEHARGLPINYLACQKCQEAAAEPSWVQQLRQITSIGDNSGGN